MRGQLEQPPDGPANTADRPDDPPDRREDGRDLLCPQPRRELLTRRRAGARRVAPVGLHSVVRGSPAPHAGDMTPSHVGPTDLQSVRGLQAPHCDGRRLWPVYLASEMQHDTPMLFELGDIVTWPVCITDVSAPDPGWPQNVAVETALTL